MGLFYFILVHVFFLNDFFSILVHLLRSPCSLQSVVTGRCFVTGCCIGLYVATLCRVCMHWLKTFFYIFLILSRTLIDRLAPVIKTIFHQCVISYSCSQTNSGGSVLKQSHQS